MSPQDFDFAIGLTDQMNWDMEEQDFKFITALEPEGCFVLLLNSKKVGIATALSFGKVGWFGNLVVERHYRKKGAGSLLVQRAIQYLKSREVETIGLYAYADTVPFYEKLGFKYDSDFTVLRGKGMSYSAKANVARVKEHDMQSIFDCDRLCFGDDRRKLLKPLLVASQNLSYMSAENGRIVGYLMAKVFDETAELGPLVCQQGRSETAINLLNTMLGSLEGFEVSICISNMESDVVNALKRLKFREDFPVARMFSGPSIASTCIYAAESLERG